MGSPDDNVQGWFDELPYKLKRELAGKIQDEAQGLADAIEANAPRLSGVLAGSVKVRRKRNTLDFEVTAGGDDTTKTYERSTDYSSAVTIDGRDNSGKQKVTKGEGEGVGYDYALASEFGTSKEEAEPFFYPTFREMKDGIQHRIEQAISDVVSKT